MSAPTQMSDHTSHEQREPPARNASLARSDPPAQHQSPTSSETRSPNTEPVTGDTNLNVVGQPFINPNAFTESNGDDHGLETSQHSFLEPRHGNHEIRPDMDLYGMEQPSSRENLHPERSNTINAHARIDTMGQVGSLDAANRLKDGGHSTDTIEAAREHASMPIPGERFSSRRHSLMADFQATNPVRLNDAKRFSGGEHQLWESVIRANVGNIFCNRTDRPPIQGGNGDKKSNSLSDFDISCWNRIRQLLSGAGACVPDSEFTNIPSPVSGPYESDAFSMPSLDVFDTVMDVFRWKFLPIASIIHIPTFSASDCPTTLLLAICELGFSLVKTKAAAEFVSQTFDRLIDAAHIALKSTMKGDSSPTSTLASFGASLLTLYIASLSGDRDMICKIQPLYIAAVTLAQAQGMFDVSDGFSYSNFWDLESTPERRWTSWCKAECMKRMAISFVELDCWFANYFSKMPIIRSEVIQIDLPSRNDLFQAASAEHWAKVIHNNPILQPASATAYAFPAYLDVQDKSRLYGYLNLLYHRICESQARAVIPRRTQEQQSGQVYEPHIDGSLRSCLVSALPYRQGTAKTSDLNSLLLWNMMCLLCCVDIHSLENASGRFGPEKAIQHLEGVQMWAQTPQARRAVLHSTEIYRLLYDRRASDALRLHVADALFVSALVLGFYFRTAPITTPDHPKVSIDLFSEIDWTSIGKCGLTDIEEGPKLPSEVPGDVHQFIRGGGDFTLQGRLFHHSRRNSRQSMMHCADLLDNISQKHDTTHSQVLRALSDTTLDTNDQQI
ncbi:hypothetical protein N7517_003461 [Penicillium concentricum]|uniref:Xylanolytic transcriptional activator regulatory domain-containing protein n=1 Tax=Penicillium concentricum TaxID=293559 RepID=A0A9X0B281_9EURO|nr:uncharacterized protein N7517_003461 [Penicillium concentricum]KAJ5385550.1 hypothetical protein N7517_003461 [Penicillium concentricum]